MPPLGLQVFLRYFFFFSSRRRHTILVGDWSSDVCSSDLGLLALQSLESNPQLSFATRMEDWTCLGQHKRHPEFPVVTRESRRNSRKTTWLPRHRKMKPFPATASREKSHGRNWRSKGHLAPLMRPTKFPEIPVSLERNTEVFRHPLLWALSPLLIWTGGSTPLLCLEGVPDLPVAPQDEAGLTKTFQTWPRGWFHIP